MADVEKHAALACFEQVDGELEQTLADGLIEVMRRWKHHWGERPVAVTLVPSRRHPLRVGSIAAHLGRVGNIPVIETLQASGPPPPTDSASGARVSGLLVGLSLRPETTVPRGPILLVDDQYRTGWTMTVAGALLRSAGATAVLPLVVHQLP